MYAEVVSTKRTDRQTAPTAQQPAPAPVYAEIVHRPVYYNKQPPKWGSAHWARTCLQPIQRGAKQKHRLVVFLWTVIININWSYSSITHTGNKLGWVCFRNNIIELEKTSSTMHCNLNAAKGRASRSGLLWGQIFTAYAQKLLHPSFRSNSDIAIRFSGSDVLQESIILAISHVFRCISLYVQKICHTFISGIYDLMTLNMYVSRVSPAVGDIFSPLTIHWPFKFGTWFHTSRAMHCRCSRSKVKDRGHRSEVKVTPQSNASAAKNATIRQRIGSAT